MILSNVAQYIPFAMTEILWLKYFSLMVLKFFCNCENFFLTISEVSREQGAPSLQASYL